MTPLKTPSGDPLPLLAVVVPKDAIAMRVINGANLTTNWLCGYRFLKPLPPGEWEVLGEVVDGVFNILSDKIPTVFVVPFDLLLSYNSITPGAGEKVVILQKKK